jgi:hypothetical protein
MVGDKWQITEHEGVRDRVGHCAAVVNHLVHGDGNGRLMTLEEDAKSVTDEDDGDSHVIEDLSRLEVVCREHDEANAVPLEPSEIEHGYWHAEPSTRSRGEASKPEPMVADAERPAPRRFFASSDSPASLQAYAPTACSHSLISFRRGIRPLATTFPSITRPGVCMIP